MTFDAWEWSKWYRQSTLYTVDEFGLLPDEVERFLTPVWRQGELF